MKSDRTDPAMNLNTNSPHARPKVGRREFLGRGAMTAAGAMGALALGKLPVSASERVAGASAARIGLPATSLTNDPAVTGLLANILHGDNAARQAAARQAQLVGTVAIASLAKAHGGDDPGAAKAALEAMQRIVHNAARPGAPDERNAAADRLVEIVAGNHSQTVRGDAIRLLGYVGGAQEVTALADLLHVPSLREDARFALERIPDSAAEKALKKAQRTVPADYRDAISQSLRNRNLKPREAGIRS
jgi:hypothetical protein